MVLVRKSVKLKGEVKTNLLMITKADCRQKAVAVYSGFFFSTRFRLSSRTGEIVIGTFST